MRDLHSNIVRQYAAQWERLGLELGLNDYDIANISENNARHPRRVEVCCGGVKSRMPCFFMLTNHHMTLVNVTCNFDCGVITKSGLMALGFIGSAFATVHNLCTDQLPIPLEATRVVTSTSIVSLDYLFIGR